MKSRDKVLIVDDSDINRSLLADMLAQDYELVEASNGLEAVTVLSQQYNEISLVLLDIVMPMMDGFEVLASMNKSGYIDHIPVIMISAETSSVYIDHAYDLGAAEYISRPFDGKTVKRRVKNTIMLYAKQKYLENMVTEQLLEKEKNNLVMVEILSHIVEFRNGESGLHVMHIRVITETLLKQLCRMTDRYNLTPEQIAMISNASALHDIGKISIPESILNKPGKLTPQEYEIIKTHSAIGAEMLEKIHYFETEKLVQVARDICRWHHERYDGRGYPDGLKGEEIPISAQVVSLADVYDALVSVRVYKAAYTHEEAMQMIFNGECGAFNPLLLECLKEAGPTLKKELKVRSLSGASRIELQDMARNLIQSGNASNRTLALLEQERTKYQFFASMSKEIQFEYNYHSDLLSISEWGAAQLGINEVIMYPKQNPQILNLFTHEHFEDFLTKIRTAEPENPILSGTYPLKIKGSSRWFKVVARPLWVMEESSELTGVIGKFIDVHDEQVELDQLKQLAKIDSLTGLFNRAYAKRALDTILNNEADASQNYALLVFDIDFFKSANDEFGHLFGGQVLANVAHRIQANVRKPDISARIGGDEFLIFMEYKDHLEQMIERIFQALNGSFQGYDITVSMGVACFPQDGLDYMTLFHHADQALYAAKRRGRRQYCCYESSMQDLLTGVSAEA